MTCPLLSISLLPLYHFEQFIPTLANLNVEYLWELSLIRIEDVSIKFSMLIFDIWLWIQCSVQIFPLHCYLSLSYLIIERLRIVHDSHSGFVDELLRTAQLYLDMQMYPIAIALLTLVIEIYPDHAFAYKQRGLCWENRYETERAIADFQRAVDCAPSESVRERYEFIILFWLCIFEVI